MELEKRSSAEIRAETEEGIVTAYLTRWDTVDSYQSTFRRGAFKKSFRERGPAKIRLIWNHEELAGKVLECKEDDAGPMVRVRFNLDTEVGKNAYAHVRAGDVDCFSFGFRTVAEGWKDGVREIREVDILEVGPVVFEANPEASITDVRSTDFEKNELQGRGSRLFDTLGQTLYEITWAFDPTQWAEAMASAIDDFKVQYLQWVSEYQSADTSQNRPMLRNAISAELRNVIGTRSFVEFAQGTEFTFDEVRTLAAGNMLSAESRGKLAAYPDLEAAHEELRKQALALALGELRDVGITEAEKTEIRELLTERVSPELMAALQNIQQYLERGQTK